MNRHIFAICLILNVFLISCHSDKNEKTTQEAQVTEHEAPTSPSDHVAVKHVANENELDDCQRWDYKGSHSPDSWAGCEPTCGGDAQSPIDISEKICEYSENLHAPEKHYHSEAVHLYNNGHTVEFPTHTDNVLTLNGDDYHLIQFHFHALSEHTIDGKHFPLEIHLVHQKSVTELAVVGILVEEGGHNKALDVLSEYLPDHRDQEVLSNSALINISDIFPEDQSYYTYGGSLTTPPCSENVTWFVMKQHIKASKEQLAHFREILHDNYRPTQPLHGRKIKFFDEHHTLAQH